MFGKVLNMPLKNTALMCLGIQMSTITTSKQSQLHRSGAFRVNLKIN